MLAGPNRDSVKKWIEGLPTETRVIFVLRAVAGFSANETADLLADHGGPGRGRMECGSSAGDLPAGAVFAGFAADSCGDGKIKTGTRGGTYGLRWCVGEYTALRFLFGTLDKEPACPHRASIGVQTTFRQISMPGFQNTIDVFRRL